MPMGPVSIGVEVQRDTDRDTPSIVSENLFLQFLFKKKLGCIIIVYCVFLFLFHSESPIELYANSFYARSVFCFKCDSLDMLSTPSVPFYFS